MLSHRYSGRLDVPVPHEALLHPERRADIINQVFTFIRETAFRCPHMW